MLYSSPFQYAVQELKLSRSVAYYFIGVARKATEIPELKEAIKNESVSVSKATRMISTITAKNARQLLAFAAVHTQEEIDIEMARISNRPLPKEQVKMLANDFVEVRLIM